MLSTLSGPSYLCWWLVTTVAGEVPAPAICAVRVAGSTVVGEGFPCEGSPARPLPAGTRGPPCPVPARPSRTGTSEGDPNNTPCTSGAAACSCQAAEQLH